MTMIFNSSLISGVFPDIWKIARVTLIFKLGAKKDVNNHRPISVISAFSRILERIVHDQLFKFLAANKVVTRNQSFHFVPFRFILFHSVPLHGSIPWFRSVVPFRFMSFPYERGLGIIY